MRVQADAFLNQDNPDNPNLSGCRWSHPKTQEHSQVGIGNFENAKVIYLLHLLTIVGYEYYNCLGL